MVMAWGLLVPGPVWGVPGEQLWQKQFTFLPQYDTITINSTALSARSYIVSGFAKNADFTGGQVGFIKAYDVATGEIKWEKTLTLGASSNAFGSIAINGDIAMVRGSYGTIVSTGPPPVYSIIKNLIIAYHVDTGDLLWEVQRDFESTPTLIGPGTITTQTANNRVFTFFAGVNTSGVVNYGTFFVRAYQVRNVVLQSLMLLD